MKNTKRKHLKLCLLLLFMVLGCFAITNVRTTTVQASSRTFKSNGRTYMEKHNDNTLNTVLYQKVSGRYKQVAKSSRYLIYRFSYGKKLYFSSADDETSDIPGGNFRTFFGDVKKLNRVFSHPLLFHIYHIINRLYTLQPAFITLSKIFNTDLFYLYACNVGVVRILSGVSTPSAVVTVYFITCGEPASTTRSTL